MISAVVPPQPLPQLQLPAVAPAPGSVRERAAAGYFRDIALWLNEPLVTQGIFVQVQADQRPGCLKLIVEFERNPIQDRLLRFLCHRIWLLNSELIEGIHVIARPVGWQRVLWQQRVKIVTPALKRRQTREQLTQSVRLGSPLPPKIRAQRRRPRQLSSQRLKMLRAFILTGSAVAAFVLGCMVEVISSKSSPTLPSFSAQAGDDATPRSQLNLPPSPTEEATNPAVARTQRRSSNTVDRAKPSLPVPARRADRPTVVDTALEPVGVIPHEKPTSVPTDEVTLLFGGDISLDNLDYAQLASAGGLFAEVEEYFKSDLSMVNLATPLANAATNLNEELHQKKRPDAVELLAQSGIDIVNLTNSNLMEYGAEGLSETLTALDRKGLYRVGAGRNAMEARRPEILDVKGKRIAYLSYAMGGDNAAMDTTALKERAGATDAEIAKEVENFKQSTAFKERAGFNAQNMPQIVEDLKALRDQVDWIVVNFRWVDHLSEKPNFVQTNLARLAIDQGADVVVGYHPTVIQGGEIYKGRPIAYSLGDFVFKTDQPQPDHDSAMLKVSLKDDQMRVEFVPVQIRNSRPKTLTGKAGEAVLQRIQQASAQFEKPMQSPVTLDLKAPSLPAEEPAAPDSPFVTPEADQTLPLEPAPKADPESKELAPAPLTQPLEPETEASPPADSLPAIDLQEQINQQLQEWGPKLSPQQKEFQPIPQDRSGAANDGNGNLDAQAQPNLLRQLMAPVSPPAQLDPSTPAQPTSGTDAWSDSVPDLPVPGQANPLPTAGEKATPVPEPVSSPPTAHPVEAEPVKPQVAEPMEPVTPTPKAIPAQAEPLVGPLGAADGTSPETVALGANSEPAAIAEPTPTPKTETP